MSTDPQTLPAPVREAKATLHAQQLLIARMIGGVFAAVGGIVVAGAAGAPEPLALAGVVGMMAWMGGHIAVIVKNAQDWKRAQDVVTAWDRHAIDAELNPHRAPAAASVAEPEDPRWSALRTLLARIRELSGDDPHIAEVADEVQRKLRGLLEDQETLRAAIEADRALGGDGDAASARQERLTAALRARGATAERLVDAVRDLHVELAVRDADADPLVDRLQGLLAQVEAETEVAAVSRNTPDPTRERARMAAARQSSRLRE